MTTRGRDGGRFGTRDEIAARRRFSLIPAPNPFARVRSFPERSHWFTVIWDCLLPVVVFDLGILTIEDLARCLLA